MKLFSWGKDTRTEEQKRVDEELNNLLDEYEKRFNKEISTEPLTISDEQLIIDIKRCLKEGITLDVIYPGINDYEDGVDY